MGFGNTVLNPLEHDEQKDVVKWSRVNYPQYRVYSTPNGGHRSKTTAAKLKAEGAVRGIPDLFWPELKLWIEMKRVKGGGLSPEQKDWIEYLNSCGYTAVMCRGAEEAKKVLLGVVKRHESTLHQNPKP